MVNLLKLIKEGKSITQQDINYTRLPKDKNNSDLKYIDKVVSEYLNIPIGFIRNKSRTPDKRVFGKKLFSYMALRYTERVSREIAEYIGLKNHSTILVHRRRIEELSDIYPEIAIITKEIRRKIDFLL